MEMQQLGMQQSTYQRIAVRPDPNVVATTG
ncbi:unnamed protein product [Gongylonema pulchrum]|uniref:Transposase n=1 Tax=Gongylonema pulchrum TaxID=637853 RepID=A0A183DAP1_9BILA|nr:unnamed protein product [Gongylonema pulchrum]